MTAPTAPTAARGVRGRIQHFRATFVWQILRRQRAWVWGMVGLGIGNTIIAIVLAATIAGLIDNAIVDQDVPLSEPLTAMISVSLFAAVAGFAQAQVVSRLAYHVEYQLRIILYNSLQGRPPEHFDDLPTGQLITRAITDLAALNAVVLLIPSLATGLVGILGTTIYVLIVNPVLAFVAMAAIPVNLILLRPFWGKLQVYSWTRLQARAEVTSAIDEHVRGIRLVKAFGRETDAEERVKDAAVGAYAHGMARVRLTALLDLVLKPIPTLVTAALTYLGVRYIVDGSMTIGQFGLVIGMAQGLVALADGLDNLGDGWSNANAGASRIQDVMFGKGADYLDFDSPVPAPGEGLRLDDVSLVASGVPVLAGFGLGVGYGQMALLRDASPLAREALVGLITGATAPASGTATLDGVALTGLSVDVRLMLLRHLVEEPFVFGRSVRENLDLAYAHDGKASDDQLWAALDAACAREIVEALPGKLDGVLGDRGLTISGGERQRLALARALVRPPRVLLLEDALSGVNPSLELEILRRVRAHSPHTAVVLLARRPTAAAVVDVIVDVHELAAHQPERTERVASGTSLPLDLELAARVAALPAPKDRPRRDPPVRGDDTERPTIISVLRPYKVQVTLICVILLAFTVAGLVPAALQSTIIDAAESSDIPRADRAIFILLSMAVLTSVSGYFLTLYYGKVDEGILFLLRRRVFGRLTKLGVNFYDRELPGAVATRAVRDLDVVSAFVDGAVYAIAVAVAMGAGAMGLLFLWAPKIALAVLGFAVVLAFVTAAQFKIADRAFTRQRLTYGEVITRFQEDFAARDLITAYDAREPMLHAFHHKALDLRSADRWSTSVSNAYESITGLMNQFATAAIYGIAGQMVINGELTTGRVIGMQAVLGRALAPVLIFSGIVRFYLAARVSFRKIEDLYQTDTGPVAPPNPVPVTSLAGAYTFDSVAFTYPNTERQVLRRVSFDAAPGELVAIVGPTGAGKSSISKLLWRVYDPDSGTITVDGHDLRTLDPAILRQRVGVVPQEPFVFTGTVASNIAFARPGASREEIFAAARRAGAYEELSELGFDTPVLEEGRNLHAADRQMIALARSVLAEPDVLLLDEATSWLEASQEARVLEAVRQLGKTTIVVAHRLAVAEKADRVVLIVDGTVVDQGPHDVLLATSEPYIELWGAQESRQPETVGHGTTRTKPKLRHRKAPLVADAPAGPGSNGSGPSAPRGGRRPNASGSGRGNGNGHANGKGSANDQ